MRQILPGAKIIDGKQEWNGLWPYQSLPGGEKKIITQTNTVKCVIIYFEKCREGKKKKIET